MLFLVTNFIVTDKQVQGTCPEVSRPFWGAVWEELGTVDPQSAVVCGMAQLPRAVGATLSCRSSGSIGVLLMKGGEMGIRS